MKNIIILFLLFQVNLSVKSYSQQLNISIESGLGSYKMSELKELNDLITSSLPFTAEVTEDFPMYWYYKPSLVYRFNNVLAAGIVWSYESTGSRISSKDYSGEYIFDNMLRASSPGVLFEFNHSLRKVELTAFSEAGMEFTKLRMKEYIALDAESQEQLYSFNSVNYYFEPGVRISYPVSVFRFSLSAGYLFDLINGDFSYEGTDNLVLNIAQGEDARADWTGIRLGISVSCILYKKDSSK